MAMREEEKWRGSSGLAGMRAASRRMSRKLALLLVTPVLVCLSIFGVLQASIWEQALMQDAERQLSDHAVSIKAMLHLANGSLPPGALGQSVQDISVGEQVHGIAFYDQELRAVAVSQMMETDLSILPDLVRGVRETGQAYRAVARMGDTNVLVHVEPLQGPERLSAFALAHSLAPVSEIMKEAFTRIMAVGGLLIGVLLVLSLLLSRSLGKNLGALVNATEHVASGDLDLGPIEATGLLDLSKVAEAFHSMIVALREARKGLEASERARSSMERRILHTQALAAAGQVTGAFAHEIGSPLNTILGLSRLCASDESLPAPTRRQMETVAVQCERIARIVQRMLGVVRTASDKRHALRLGEVIGEVASFLELDLRTRGIEISLDIAADLPPILGSKDLMFQVLLNLCNNAADAQPDGGVIRISAHVLEGKTGSPDETKTVVLEVADGGSGIPEERRARIFEPFYSTKAEEGGTGLGLSIVASVVRDAGGSIRVEQAPEGGALFRIELSAA